MRVQDFYLNSLQCTVFTEGPLQDPPAKVLRTVLSRFGERFNGELQAIPLPDDAPQHLPRVSMTSSDEAWKMQASPSRIDIFWNATIERLRENVPLRTPYSSAFEVINALITEHSISPARAAMVAKRVSFVERPAEVLLEYFCKPELRANDGPLRRSDTFELHNHKRFSLEPVGVVVNSWMRCKTAEIAGTGELVALVEQDINSLVENIASQRFTSESLQAFFESASLQLDATLALYFPGSSS